MVSTTRRVLMPKSIRCCKSVMCSGLPLSLLSTTPTHISNSPLHSNRPTQPNAPALRTRKLDGSNSPSWPVRSLFLTPTLLLTSRSVVTNKNALDYRHQMGPSPVRASGRELATNYWDARALDSPRMGRDNLVSLVGHHHHPTIPAMRQSPSPPITPTHNLLLLSKRPWASTPLRSTKQARTIPKALL